MNEKKCEKIIIYFMSILPFIDLLNNLKLFGIESLASVYKMFFCFVLFLIVYKYKMISIKFVLPFAIIIGYIILTIGINYLLQGSQNVSFQYAYKFVYNIVLFGLLFQCIKVRIITSGTIMRILNYCTWIFTACFLIPYMGGGRKNCICRWNRV